jgi:hypothetical protein
VSGTLFIQGTGKRKVKISGMPLGEAGRMVRSPGRAGASEQADTHTRLAHSEPSSAIHYGGGLNYWLRRRIGLRFEFRHHIWSPEAGEAVHLVGFRVGVVFGMR